MGLSSGRRDSNPQHSAWKAEALPIELLPLLILQIKFEIFNPAIKIYKKLNSMYSF